MDLRDVLRDTGVNPPLAGAEISEVVNDSRKCGPGSLYIAASGYVEDAHPFASDAFARGCRHFLVQAGRESALAAECPGASFYPAPDVKHALAMAAKAFYRDPS